jgi:tetratricopeptide (TPR) repeat protein
MEKAASVRERYGHHRLILGVTVAVGLAQGCGSSNSAAPPPTAVGPLDGEPSDPIVAAERALTIGNSPRAVRLVEKIGPLDPQFEKASDILERARFEVEAVAIDWLDQIDGLVAKGELMEARDRANNLAAEFPLGDDLKGEVQLRLKQVDEATPKSEQRLADLDRQATDQLLRHDLEGALQTLRDAQATAHGIDPTRAFARQRAIDAIELRMDQQKAVAAGEPATDRNALKARRQNLRRKRPAEKPAAVVQPDKTAAKPPAAPDPANDQRIQELLRDAARYQKEKDWYQAIMAFEKVRRIDTKNEAAKVALDSLESKRQALIKDNLAKANAHFLKQDLAGAVPFFKKVRDLDPGNQEAREGLEMYENLERIRGNQAAGPPR